MSTNQFIYLISSILGLVIISVIISLIIEKSKGRGRVVRALNMSLFLIKLPQESSDNVSVEDKKSRIAVMEQFLAGLTSLREKSFYKRFFYDRPYIVLEMAVPFSTPEISFYLAAPRKYHSFLEKQIHGFYPKASVERIEDYNIFSPGGAYSGGFLSLEKSSVLPIKTYKTLEMDPLESISNALSKIEDIGEGGTIQFLIRPAHKDWNKKAMSVVVSMNQGLSFKDALAGKARKEQKPGELMPTPSPLDQEVMKAIQEKASKPGFEVGVRILFSAQKEERSEELLSHAAGAFDQFSSPNLNSFKLEKKANSQLKKLCFNFCFRLFNVKEKIILNSEEVASLIHFPLASISSPKVAWLKARESEPPTTIPKQGIILGKNVFRGEEAVIRMDDNDRRRHLYMVGQTGTGKTTAMLNMIKQDIENGKGLAFIDPHGDSVEKILGFIPKERIDDVIYFDPADVKKPMGLNLLEFDPKYPEQKTFITNETINIFRKLWEDVPEAFGPMFEQYMRNALLLIVDDPGSGSTLLEVPKVLADAEFRRHKLSKTNNTVVKDFWQKEAEKAGGEAALANIVPYITSKTNVFLANDVMRPIICQQKSAFDFRKIMDENKILLVNLSKGKLGDVNSKLLGLIVVGKILMSSFSRVDIPEEKRNDFYLYIDEFQNFTTESISTILAEARKYRLNLTIAHQFIGQLREDIKKAVFGNVGSMMCFRVGAEDAEFLVKQFEPTFSQQDLINIDNFNAYLKLLISNQTNKPFNIVIYPPIKEDLINVEKIKEASRMKYGRDKTEVEKEIQERSKIEKESFYGANIPAEEPGFK